MPKLGARKDKVDDRDYKFDRVRAVIKAVVLPPKIDHTDKMTDIKNQGSEGSCVGFGGTAMKEYQDKKELGRDIDLSERFLYYRAQEEGEIPHEEEGAYPRDAMTVLQKQGICTEICWPYVAGRPGEPCEKVVDIALPYKIKSYIRLANIQEMKESLVNNGPFLASVAVYSGFMNAPKGVVPMPKDGEQLQGGHAICIVGYDDAGQPPKPWWQGIIDFFLKLIGRYTPPKITPFFKFKNSWGKFWGDSGYGYLSYEYVDKYLWDAWAAYDLPNIPNTEG